MNKSSFYAEIRKNKVYSVLLMVFVLLGLAGIGLVIGLIYNPGVASFFVIIAVSIALIMIWTSYYYSDKIILSTVKARPANRKEHTYLVNALEGLCLGAGCRMPKLYVIDNPDINAFATGRDPEHAVICVTTGALEKLNRAELEGVLAHELSHVTNYDIRFSAVVATLVGMVIILSDLLLRSFWFSGGRGNRDRGGIGVILLVAGIIFAILAPIAMKLVQLAISRRREYLADASGARLTRYPEGLANALEKIEKYNTGKLKVSKSVNHLFISNPLRHANISSLFSTHPPLKERVKRLKSM